MQNTAILSVSSEAPLNCYDLAKFLSRAGVMTNVTANITTQPNVEYGCRVVQPVSTKNEIEKTWHLLKDRYRFECAHLKIDGIYSGCILDYLRPSLCGKK